MWSDGNILHSLEASRDCKNKFVEGFLLSRMIKQEACLCEDIANTIKNLGGKGLAGLPKMKLEWDLLDFY